MTRFIKYERKNDNIVNPLLIAIKLIKEKNKREQHKQWDELTDIYIAHLVTKKLNLCIVIAKHTILHDVWCKDIDSSVAFPALYGIRSIRMIQYWLLDNLLFWDGV